MVRPRLLQVGRVTTHCVLTEAGLKRITLKVRVESASPSSSVNLARSGAGDATEPVVNPDGSPNVTIMHHLLGVFMEHFGCQFPALDHQSLDSDLLIGNGSVFLFLCMAAIASR